MTAPGQKQPKPWTQDEAQTAAELRQEHFVEIHGEEIKVAPQRAAVNAFQRIATATKRDYQSVWGRYHRYGPGFGGNQPGYNKVSPLALAERALRKDAEMRQSPIAALLGEPPPGYSALDKRKSEGSSA